MTTDVLDSTVYPTSSTFFNSADLAESNPLTVKGDVTRISVSSQNIRLFQNPNFKVRVIMRMSKPWFVAKDVATCIEHSNVTKMCELCRNKDKIVVDVEELKTNDLLVLGNRGLTCISESGLYRILAKCNLPKCEPFESWVFDEVLPSIRETGTYSAKPTTPQTYLEALKALVASEEAKLALQAERDEAVRSKYLFVEGRDAKVCGELGGLRTQNEALRKQIGDSKRYKAVSAITWITDYFDISNRGVYGSLASKLKKVEEEMGAGYEHINIPDSKYGTVKAYHIDVIERLHAMIQSDESLMAKYRKILSV